MVDVLIVNPPSPDGHVYIRDVCRWGRKSREKMIWPQTSLAYLAAMVPETMSVRIIDAIAEGMPPEKFFDEVRREKPKFYVTYITGTTFEIDAQGVQVAKECGATTTACRSSAGGTSGCSPTAAARTPAPTASRASSGARACATAPPRRSSRSSSTSTSTTCTTCCSSPTCSPTTAWACSSCAR